MFKNFKEWQAINEERGFYKIIDENGNVTNERGELPPFLYRLKGDFPDYNDGTYVIEFDDWKQEICFYNEAIKRGMLTPEFMQIDYRKNKRKIKMTKGGECFKSLEPYPHYVVHIPAHVREFHFLDLFEPDPDKKGLLEAYNLGLY